MCPFLSIDIITVPYIRCNENLFSKYIFGCPPRRIVPWTSCIPIAYNTYRRSPPLGWILYILGGGYGIMLASLLTLKEDDE